MTDTLCAVPHAADPDRPRLALDGLRTCQGHRVQIHDRLYQLGAAHEALAARLTAAGMGGGRVSGTRPVGITLDPRVAVCRSDIYTCLAGWAREVMQHRYGLRPPDDDCPSIAGFLVRHLDWLCALPADDVARLAADLALYRGRAFGLLYPSGRRRKTVGQCVETTWCTVEDRTERRCPGELSAFLTAVDDLLPASLVCDTCGAEITADRWYAFGRRYQALEGVA